MRLNRFAWLTAIFCFAGAAACGSTVETDSNPPDEEVEVHPEAICTKWVADVCGALTGCCSGGDEFDAVGCEVQLSYSCLSSLDPELIRSGALDYDEAAAKKCFSYVPGCDLQGAADPEIEEACRTMLTGHRELGTACDNVAQCAPVEGGKATCYFGDFVGICAKVVATSDDTCGFSLADSTLRECPEGTFCDYGSKTVPPDASPTEAGYVFEAPCKAYLGIGQSCYDAENGAILECAPGLYCDYYEAMGPEDLKCAQSKPEGAACQDSYQCAAGLDCDYDTATCTGGQGAFCYGPTVCGDGQCTGAEEYETCPQDCGGTYCGDGYCDFDEEFECPEDCGETGYCGDGYCDFDEDELSCIDDCGYCGDGYCGPDEDEFSCVSDCGYCGDGYCGPGETTNNCPGDCGSECSTCAEYLTEGGPDLCAGESTDLYDAVVICVCEGACMAACGDNACQGIEMTIECQDCILDSNTGCGNEYAACANDI